MTTTFGNQQVIEIELEFGRQLAVSLTPGGIGQWWHKGLPEAWLQVLLVDRLHETDELAPQIARALERPTFGEAPISDRRTESRIVNRVRH